MLQGVRELGALCVCAHGLLAGVGLEQGRELDREQEQIGAGGLIGRLCQFGETGREEGLIIIGIHAQQIRAEERWKASCTLVQTDIIQLPRCVQK
jgi:hypothetical protein